MAGFGMRRSSYQLLFNKPQLQYSETESTTKLVGNALPSPIGHCQLFTEACSPHEICRIPSHLLLRHLFAKLQYGNTDSEVTHSEMCCHFLYVSSTEPSTSQVFVGLLRSIFQYLSAEIWSLPIGLQFAVPTCRDVVASSRNNHMLRSIHQVFSQIVYFHPNLWGDYPI